VERDDGAGGEGIRGVLRCDCFLDYFKDLPDRRQRGKAVYPLEEILLLCLLAVIAGADSLIDIARFGEKKLDLLRRFRPFRGGHEIRCLSGARRRPRSSPALSRSALARRGCRLLSSRMTKISYAGYRFPPVIIQQAIWLYLRFSLSFRDVEDLLAIPLRSKTL